MLTEEWLGALLPWLTSGIAFVILIWLLRSELKELVLRRRLWFKSKHPLKKNRYTLRY